eukprot:5597217-Pyramimonas_sp.AAC.1
MRGARPVDCEVQCGGDPCQEAPCVPPGCRGFLRTRWFCGGDRDVLTPRINGRPGASVLGFSWEVSCGRAPN